MVADSNPLDGAGKQTNNDYHSITSLVVSVACPVENRFYRTDDVVGSAVVALINLPSINHRPIVENGGTQYRLNSLQLEHGSGDCNVNHVQEILGHI